MAYIDAELLKENFAKRVNKHYGIMLKIDDVAVDLGLAIADTPTADVEEVVRCCECKYQITHTCRITGVKTLFCDYGEKPVAVEPTHFCRYGERREE